MVSHTMSRDPPLTPSCDSTATHLQQYVDCTNSSFSDDGTVSGSTLLFLHPMLPYATLCCLKLPMVPKANAVRQ